MADKESKPDFENPKVVKAEKRMQAGYEILLGDCPHCGRRMALNGPGRGLCGCGWWLKLETE